LRAVSKPCFATHGEKRAKPPLEARAVIRARRGARNRAYFDARRLRRARTAEYPMHPFTVALTGGIASGKSAVARRFDALGASVVDADAIARELVQPGMAALDEIAAAFGPQILGADGSLERAEMRAIVFGDAEARRRLETILHPRVRAEMLVRTDTATGPYVLLVVPLFVETAGYGWVDRVLVVDLPRNLQLARAIARDSMPTSLAEAMIDAQVTREQRLAIADDVIDNSGSLEALDAQVDALHRHYIELAELRADTRSGG
jgi:dephospho-CoA kinase